MRDARAFSCVGSGVDDLRLVHAAGEGVRRLPDSASTCVGLAREGGGGVALSWLDPSWSLGWHYGVTLYVHVSIIYLIFGDLTIPGMSNTETG